MGYDWRMHSVGVGGSLCLDFSMEQDLVFTLILLLTLSYLPSLVDLGLNIYSNMPALE